MHTFQVRNVNHALPLGLSMLRDNGKLISPRGLDTMELEGAVATVYHRPREMVLFDPIRDANPMFHFFEALWILQGRNDVAFLAHFNAKMAEFSDNGKTFHAPYGYRMRKPFGWPLRTGDTVQPFDQIEACVAKLRTDPDSRQACISIWDVTQDWQRTKDVPCLAGDTVMCSPEGDIRLSQLYDKFDCGIISSYPVFTFDEKTSEFGLSNCTNVVSSGVKKTIVLVMENGERITLTPDHRMYRRFNTRNSSGHLEGGDFEVVEAQKLKIGDRLLSTVFTEDYKGYRLYKRQAFKNTNFDNMVKVSRDYFQWATGADLSDEFPYPTWDVHHKDENKSNDSLPNLELQQHAYHSHEHKLGAQNPIHKETQLKRRERLTKRRAALRRRGWNVPDHPDDTLLAYIFDPEVKPKWVKSEQTAPNLSRIVAIENGPEIEVFDFQVEGTHNALINSGIVAHNCNDFIMLKVRDMKLRMTVCNRSNDVVWGAYGANVVQFSTLLVYLAMRIGVGVGEYTQLSDSYHVYEDNPYWKSFLALHSAGVPTPDDPYEYDEELREKSKWLTNPHEFLSLDFDADLATFFAIFDGKAPEQTGWDTESFASVVWPMWLTHAAWKAKDRIKAMAHCSNIEAPDWRKACREWMQRRIVK